MKNGCVFFVGNNLDKEMTDKLTEEFSVDKDHVHELNHKVLKRRGGLAQLMLTGRTINFFFGTGVPESEINIVKAHKLSYFTMRNGEVVHSTALTKPCENLN